MVFSSVPVYLDSSNWQQQPNQQGAGNESPHLPAVPASNNHVAVGGGGTGSSTRPGSMADRARLANLPHPEAALKCPRCESTNTKFCYYNNYSLSQQRHFCKTCRRYWTKGGALRNVPVGGGCRRNRKGRSQSSSSKSPVSSERQAGSSSTSAIPSEIVGRLPQQTAQHHQLPFMTSLHNNLTRFGVANFGLNFSGVQGAIGQNEMGFQMGSNSGMSSSIGMQQFPLIEPASTGLYPFQSREGAEAVTSSSRVSQSAPVKMEGNQGLNIPIRPFFSIPDNNQYWGGNTWTDLSGLNSPSASHLL